MNPKLIPAEVTKTMNIQPVGSNLLLKERADASLEAERILHKAGRSAKAIINKARDKVRVARHRGFEEGKKVGYQEIAKHVAQTAYWHEKAFDRFIPHIVDLASALAHRILRKELELDPQSVETICREIIRENCPGDRLTLVVHPDDLDLLSNTNTDLGSEPWTTIEFEASKKLERGDCIIHSESGRVDGRLKVQIEELKKILIEENNEA
jgi:flagellar biosynthesis/type III secretory pathway protein FliH